MMPLKKRRETEQDLLQISKILYIVWSVTCVLFMLGYKRRKVIYNTGWFSSLMCIIPNRKKKKNEVTFVT